MIERSPEDVLVEVEVVVDQDVAKSHREDQPTGEPGVEAIAPKDVEVARVGLGPSAAQIGSQTSGDVDATLDRELYRVLGRQPAAEGRVLGAAPIHADRLQLDQELVQSREPRLDTRDVGQSCRPGFGDGGVGRARPGRAPRRRTPAPCPA
jgi:hypothetical protein